MDQRDVILLTLRGLLIWLILSALVWYFEVWLGNMLLPLNEAFIMIMAPEFSPMLKLAKLVQSEFNYSIELSAWVLHPVYINANLKIPLGTELKSSTHLLHILVPVVIEWSILLVWPVKHWSQRALLITFGLLTASLIVLATLPAILLGLLEISFQQVAMTGKYPRPVPWFLDWMIFCELGGGWLLAIIGAWLCIKLQRILLRF